MIATATKNGHAKTTNGAEGPGPATSDHDAGRDANGRFAQGNKLGTGNPFARQVAAFRRRIVDRVKPEDLDQIVDDLVVKAKTGDLAATKLLLGYLVGKPSGVVNPDTLEWEEWQMRAQSPTRDEHTQVSARLPCDLANLYAGSMDDAKWCIARQEIEKAIPRWAAHDAKVAAAKREREPARHSARSLSANRMTACLGRPPKKAK